MREYSLVVVLALASCWSAAANAQSRSVLMEGNRALLVNEAAGESLDDRISVFNVGLPAVETPRALTEFVEQEEEETAEDDVLVDIFRERLEVFSARSAGESDTNAAAASSRLASQNIDDSLEASLEAVSSGRSGPFFRIIRRIIERRREREREPVTPSGEGEGGERPEEGEAPRESEEAGRSEER